MNRFFRELHLWLSVPFGIVITITCFTGAMLVFETEITALCNRGITTVEVVGQPLPLEQLVEKVAGSLNDEVVATGITISSDSTEAYKVNLSKPHRAAIYVDQYTGEVKGYYERLPFFNVMRRLHRWLMDTRPSDGGIYWGKMIVGSSTLAFAVILITGLAIWWPRNRKVLKNRLKVVVSKGWVRFWHDLHVAGGFYALLLLLAMALTGLTWSFEWYRDGFYSMFDEQIAHDSAVQFVKKVRDEAVDVQAGSVAVAVDSIKSETYGEAVSLADAVSSATVQADAVSSATVQTDAVSSATVQTDAVTSATTPVVAEPQQMPWQQALDNVLAKNPDFETITISAGVVTVAPAGFGNKRASDRYYFNENTGEITSVELYAEAEMRNKAVGWVRTIHVGSWGGVVSKVFYFLAALLGATLPLTGYYLWIKRLYAKRKSRN